LIVISILFSACATSGGSTKKSKNDPAANAQAARDAQAQANAALAAMDGGGRAPAASGSGTARAPAAAAPAQAAPAQPASGSQPAWVDNPDSAYDRQLYITARGNGSNRTAAERDALAKITGVFGQTIQADMKIMSSYSEAVKGGTIQVSESTQVQDAITTSAQMDTLIGAEVRENWHDTRNNVYYSLAVMEREKTSVLYSDLIRSNERIINDLTTMTPQVRSTLDGYARYRLAGTIADVNRAYANVLTVVGNTRGIDPARMKKGDDYRIEAAEIVKNIPFGVIVSGDSGNRIKNALAKAIGASGFRSGGDNSRYVMKFNYVANEADFPGQPNKMVRYELIGGLEDTTTRTVMFPYSLTGRSGHITVSEAEQRALRSVETSIGDEFGPALKEYLDNLISIK